MIQSRSFGHFLIGKIVYERGTKKIASTLKEKIIWMKFKFQQLEAMIQNRVAKVNEYIF